MQKQEPIGLLVAVVRRRIKQAVGAVVRPYRLSPQQFWTLIAIARQEGLSLTELSDRQRMDQPTACRVVSTLARRRLVRSGPDPSDRRRSRLVLTPSGRAMAEQLLPVVAAIRTAVESGLTPAERNAIVGGLRKVVASLDRFEARGLAAGSAAGAVIR